MAATPGGATGNARMRPSDAATPPLPAGGPALTQPATRRSESQRARAAAPQPPTRRTGSAAPAPPSKRPARTKTRPPTGAAGLGPMPGPWSGRWHTPSPARQASPRVSIPRPQGLCGVHIAARVAGSPRARTATRVIPECPLAPRMVLQCPHRGRGARPVPAPGHRGRAPATRPGPPQARPERVGAAGAAPVLTWVAV